MPGKTQQPVCLTIAGLDPSGGAGVLADIKTFAAFGCFGTAAVTSITFQNTTGVFGAEHVSADALRRQIEPIFDDYEVAAVKTGMLPTPQSIEIVGEILKDRQVHHIIVDPVVRSTSGYDLIDDEALATLIERLFPLATLVTPNLPEVERITGLSIAGPEGAGAAASRMHDLGAKMVLVKGGHFAEAAAGHATDILYDNGSAPRVFDGRRIDSTSTHGTGCTLSAAIAANLALGESLIVAIEAAKRYVTEAIRTAPGIGRGHGPVNHLIKT